MRHQVCAAVFALATGLLLAPSDLAAADPPASANEVIDRVLASPRLYGVAASGAMKSQDGIKMCLGGEPLRKMFQALAEHPEIGAELSKGCVHKIERDPPKSFRYEQTCDEAAGALFTSHHVLEGSPDRIHQHMELTLKVAHPTDPPHVMVGDTVMTYLGECPANLKPGQFLDRDGTVTDPFSDLGLGKTPAKTPGVAPK